MRRSLTVGELSGILELAPRTVCRMIDTGLLRGYRVPARTGDRRVTVDTLRAFMAKREIPAEWLERFLTRKCNRCFCECHGAIP